MGLSRSALANAGPSFPCASHPAHAAAAAPKTRLPWPATLCRPSRGPGLPGSEPLLTGIVGSRWVGRHHRGGGGVPVLSGPLGGGGKRAGDVVQRRLPPRVRDGQEAAREFQQQALPPGRLERRLAAQAREEIVDVTSQPLCHPPELAGGEAVDALLVSSGLVV